MYVCDLKLEYVIYAIVFDISFKSKNLVWPFVIFLFDQMFRIRSTHSAKQYYFNRFIQVFEIYLKIIYVFYYLL